MRKLVTIFSALCCMSTLALAQGGKPQVVLLHLGDDPADPDSEAIVVPAASPIRLASFPRDHESNAAFRGRFTLTGSYELNGSGENAYITLWPDEKSRAALPFWRVRGGPNTIYLSNGWAFALAVVPKAELHKLKADTDFVVRGHVTIIADDYRASIDCDLASFSARFVSVVEAPVRIAAIPQSEGGC